MKNDSLTGILLAVLAASALASLACMYLFFSRERDMRSMQPQLMNINANSQMFNALFNEVAEYGKRNPSLDAALQSNPLWKNRATAGKPAAK